MTATQLDQLFEDAEAYIDTCATRAATDWNMGTHHRYETDPSTGIITWLNHDKPLLRGEYRILGTHITAADAFHWAWTDRSTAKHLLTDADAVRDYGEFNGIPALSNPRLDLTLEGGWQLAALASMLVRADFVHLVNTPDSSTFLAVRNLRPPD